LKKRGHNVGWVRTAKPGIGDRAILEWAQTENRLLVKRDFFTEGNKGKKG